MKLLMQSASSLTSPPSMLALIANGHWFDTRPKKPFQIVIFGCGIGRLLTGKTRYKVMKTIKKSCVQLI